MCCQFTASRCHPQPLRGERASPLATATGLRTLTSTGQQAHTGDESLERIAERCVNQGGEPGHDDYGLPPVDVVIPDDARELYRDVQAYHRELRALRRQERSMRWRAPFRRSGIGLPLIAGCLVAALVAVMISAMFTANPYFSGNYNRPTTSTGTSRSTRSTGSSASPTSGSLANNRSDDLATSPPAGNRLPAGKAITVAGKPVRLSTLMSAVLALIPARCGCTTAVRQLLAQAATAGVNLYLVAPRGSNPAGLNKLVADTGGGTGSTRVATDSDDVLTAMFRPTGLTVLLVVAHGMVSLAPRLGPNLEKQLRSLRHAG